MFFLTDRECTQWLSDRGKSLPEQSGWATHTIKYPATAPGIYTLAQSLAAFISADDEVLLWIKEWGIWSNTENLHLYYKLRQSYANHQPLHAAPGHLFLKHEWEDLKTYLQVAMLNGWGGYIFPYGANKAVFFSHDSY